MKRRIKWWVVIGFQLVFAASVVFFADKTQARKFKKSKQFTVKEQVGEFELPDSVTPTPTLVIPTKDKPIELGMTDLKAHIEVIGNVAITTLDMLFYNDQDRILEGELVFPLCEGQFVSGFALEIDGRLRDAVAVEKQQARIAFEQTVRQNIDPALIEMTKGNNFKTRVYPIPAKGTKRIVVTIQQELKLSKGHPFYQLPLRYKQALKQFKLEVNSYDQRAMPIVRSACLGELEFQPAKNSFTASIQKTNFQTQEDFVFSLPVWNDEVRSLTQSRDNKQYFYLYFSPEKLARQKQKPSVITLLWDVSASAASKNTGKETELIEAYLKQLGEVELELVTFSSGIHSKERFKIKDGRANELIETIKDLDYDGGTQLGSIDLRGLAGEEILLSTDGISNFGKHEIIPASDKAVYAINSVPGAEFSVLQALCDRTGGEFLNLNQIGIEAALHKLSTEEMKFIGISPNAQVSNHYPSIPCSIGEQFSMSGIVKGETCSLELLFGFGNEVVLRKEVVIEANGPQTINLHLDRIWAQKALSQLDLNYKQHKSQITAIGKQFNLLTRNTSFIVLDRVADYVEHEIVPPKELQAAYFSLLKDNQKNEEEEKQSHLKQVKKDFEQRKEWYKRSFKAVEEKKASVHFTEPQLEGATHDQAMSIPQEVTFTSSAATGASSSNYAIAPGTYANSTALLNKSEAPSYSDQAAIVMDEWSPDVPYLKVLKKASGKRLYRTYLDLKADYASQPSFFLDVADYFLKLKRRDEAIRILSNIAEMELEDHTLLRILAHRLEQINELKAAIAIYEDIRELREEEPQSFRDLGLAYARDGRPQKAIETLYHVVENPWDGRFHQIESLVLVELNQIIQRSSKKLDLSRIDPDFIVPMETDIRVVLNWDTDDCDMDLWVTDPRGEKCFYSNNLTQLGGRMSADITQGYGPEEFLLKKAVRGKYKVQVNYYGISSQKTIGQSTIYMEIYTNYGRKNQGVKYATRRLESRSEVLDLAEFVF